jgi:hypothetical protein
MTDKERLESLLHECGDDFEDIVETFLERYLPNFPPSRLYDLEAIVRGFLRTKLRNYQKVADIAYERATYLKDYLQGKMFGTEESARQHVGCQINNTIAIIDAYHKARGKRGD